MAVTAPYMHDGSIASLRGVIEHYAAGGRGIAVGLLAGDGAPHPNKSEVLTGFEATEAEIADLIAFLHSLADDTLLTDPRYADPRPLDHAATRTRIMPQDGDN